MAIPEVPPLLSDLPPDLPLDQIERMRKILAPILTSLRKRSSRLPQEADLALTYHLPEDDGR